ncbi:hypothetical protein AP75_12990 [Kaistella haifensis DSM 19056]|uniref:Streptomycin biosynthesis protein StrF domain-containing protein n=1 Tax=Kaistella haifensis DSM 19056 TaxID=1450526 RepID=A0A246B6U2_9FLAO|nr:glycosyltransferase [Kaistella haifensis]OWK97105.1 hypothetical protein AP75_12990 [Kaistella haifensis DSM 19056]
MLSIIISSYQPHYFTALEKNIAETVGVPYEIIKIDNPGLMGICEAYNKGAEKAKYEYLLFLHEDVMINTQHWGKELLELFCNKNIGVVGIAGCPYIPNVPFAWWNLFASDFRNFKQYDREVFIREYSLMEDKLVFALDGVFLACRRAVWKAFPFNENIKGFHAYDIDFSVRIANSYQNIVSSKILLSHFSQGKMDEKWFRSLIQSRDCFAAPRSQKTNKKYEFFFYTTFEEYLSQFHFPKKEKRKLLLKYNKPKFIGYKAFLRNLFK